MPVSGNALAYCTVVVVGIALFTIGTPAERSLAVDARLAASRPATPAYSVELDKRLAAYAAAVGPHAAATTAEASGIRLHSVGFDFPSSDREFPGGSAADIVTNNCTACHSPGMILNQPRLTKAEWTGEVAKMINTYKAPVAEENLAGIVAYLANMKVPP